MEANWGNDFQTDEYPLYIAACSQSQGRDRATTVTRKKKMCVANGNPLVLRVLARESVYFNILRNA